jgi:flagellar motor protein MotB
MLKRRRRELFEDPLQHLWAISYSDLLMVLMTFFILFFKFGSLMTKVSPLDGVLRKLKQNGGYAAGSRGIASENAGGLNSAVPLPIQAVAGRFSDGKLNFKVIGKGRELLVDFPDNFYPLGQYVISDLQKIELLKTLELLLPFKETVSLTFIGHTDDLPLTRSNQIINSNLVLSNLRASRAAEFALLQGFDPSWVSTRGVGQYQRRQRSLSLLVSERSKP